MPKEKTTRRLWDSFAAESAAAMKYNFYAQAARREGYQQIADILEKTAANETMHAKLWLNALEEMASGEQPGDTAKNLRKAAQGEHEEWTKQYKECALDARAEGEEMIAQRFERVAAIEASHEKRFLKLVENLESGQVFSKPQQPAAVWRCRVCGHLHTGPEAPKACPVCAHAQAYFELEAENY